jgi:RNA polymerase sigma-70 factor (ECF subfamily)
MVVGRVNDDQTERLARAKGGDGPAFEELLAPLVEPAFRLAMTILKDTSAAEDAVQESALNAWRHLGRLRRGASLRPWFLAMVANECRDARRTRWWSVQRFAHIVQKEVRDQHWADRMDLDAALDRLPRYHLQVLVLYYHLDLPIDEVARVLRCSEGAARQRIHRALNALRPGMMMEADA